MLVSTTEGNMPVNKLVGRRFTAMVHGKYYESEYNGFEFIGNKRVSKITAKDQNDKNTTVFLYGSDLLKHMYDNFYQWTLYHDLKVNDVVMGDNRINYTITNIEDSEDPNSIKYIMDVYACYKPNGYILNKLLVQNY